MIPRKQEYKLSAKTFNIEHNITAS